MGSAARLPAHASVCAVRAARRAASRGAAAGGRDMSETESGAAGKGERPCSAAPLPPGPRRNAGALPAAGAAQPGRSSGTAAACQGK